LRVKPIDVQVSEWACTVEHEADGSLSLRMGLGYAKGLRKLAGNDFDVLLMDPQYVTAMLRDDCADDSKQMVSLIAAAAENAKVNLFRRWALMRHWHVHNNVALPDMIDPSDQPDQLHQNDWSTMLISQALVTAITRRVATAAGS